MTYSDEGTILWLMCKSLTFDMNVCIRDHVPRELLGRLLTITCFMDKRKGRKKESGRRS